MRHAPVKVVLCRKLLWNPETMTPSPGMWLFGHVWLRSVVIDVSLLHGGVVVRRVAKAEVGSPWRVVHVVLVSYRRLKDGAGHQLLIAGHDRR